MTIATTTPEPTATPAPAIASRRGRATALTAALSKGALVLLAGALTPVAWSFGHALTYPGTEPSGVRVTEWVRDHGGRGLVAWAENTWYEHHQPKRGGVPSPSALPVITAAPAPTAPAVGPNLSPAPVGMTYAPVTVRPLASPALPGEGVWQPTGRRGPDGLPLLYTTFVRPDPIHTSLVTGLAWMDPKRLRFDLYSGDQQPGGPGWQLEAPLPFAVRPSLVAAFNSGFKLQDSRGGYMAEGRGAPGHPLVPGQASLIFRTNGTVTVGAWGRDAFPGPSIRAVRQNLQLLIDGGVEAPDLDHNSLARWGYTVKNQTLVWRSGVGVNAAGDLIYAAGNGLSVHSLADVLLAAGCIRAMELDINSEWVDFFSYTDAPMVPGGSVGTKLIPDMRPPVDKYFAPSDRDFIAAFARTAA